MRMTPVLSDGALYGVAGRHRREPKSFALTPSTEKLIGVTASRREEEIDGRILELELFRGAFLKVEDFFVCLSEIGSLLTVKMDQKGWRIVSKNPFSSHPALWTLPALSKGLLYVMQNETDRRTGQGRESSATTFDKGDEHDPNHRSRPLGFKKALAYLVDEKLAPLIQLGSFGQNSTRAQKNFGDRQFGRRPNPLRHPLRNLSSCCPWYGMIPY